MGAADVVPGVSGGTIAFITGIYEELINSINQINLSALKVFKQNGLLAFWKHVNGNFLLALLSGIAVSIISLAKGITYLLEAHPIFIWSFFFGLVFASIFFVAKQIKKWNLLVIIGLVVGAVFAFYITTLPAQTESNALWYIFLSGMVAICAMILPGISGSFILLLLGSYKVVLTAIHERNLLTLAVFGSGAVIGLLSFAKLLKWMFAKHHNVTIAVLSGFLVGSLNKIWPWKETLSTFTKHAGEANEEIIPLEQVSISPARFEELTGQPSLLTGAIGMFLVGLAVILAMEWASRFKSKKA